MTAICAVALALAVIWISAEFPRFQQSGLGKHGVWLAAGCLAIAGLALWQLLP